MSDKIEIWKNEATNYNIPFGKMAEDRVKHINDGQAVFYDSDAGRLNDMASAHGWRFKRISKPKPA